MARPIVILAWVISTATRHTRYRDTYFKKRIRDFKGQWKKFIVSRMSQSLQIIQETLKSAVSTLMNY